MRLITYKILITRQNVHIYTVYTCDCDWNSSVKARCSYLHPSCGTCCSVCWRSVRTAGQVGWSASWLCGSAPASGRCSETWSPGWGTSLGEPRGTRACCKQHARISRNRKEVHVSVFFSPHELPQFFQAVSWEPSAWCRCMKELRRPTFGTNTLLFCPTMMLPPCAHVRQRTSYLKNVWCSTHTFHSLLAARWFGSLNPIVLSNCSNCQRDGTSSCSFDRKTMTIAVVCCSSSTHAHCRCH